MDHPKKQHGRFGVHLSQRIGCYPERIEVLEVKTRKKVILMAFGPWFDGRDDLYDLPCDVHRDKDKHKKLSGLSETIELKQNDCNCGEQTLGDKPPCPVHDKGKFLG